MSEAAKRRLSARVVGRVQGVGFRWWTVRQAQELGLTGWVMNGHDERTVEIVAEGQQDSLDELERRLRGGAPGSYVETVELQRSAASGEYGRFGIMRS
ncbi:MAG: acylphosphatase [Chloroflexota bacterium]|nr:acylphosphatase [Chloroflexota bacterium]